MLRTNTAKLPDQWKTALNGQILSWSQFGWRYGFWMLFLCALWPLSRSYALKFSIVHGNWEIFCISDFFGDGTVVQMQTDTQNRRIFWQVHSYIFLIKLYLKEKIATCVTDFKWKFQQLSQACYAEKQTTLFLSCAEINERLFLCVTAFLSIFSAEKFRLNNKLKLEWPFFI